MRGVRARGTLLPVCAAAHGDRLRQQRADRGIPAKERKRMPDTGFFAEADPNAELRKPGGFVENVDFTKRGGRYQSDFIWNVDWQTQLDKQESSERARKRAREAPPPETTGGLGIARRLNLDSMDVDLSSVLSQPKPDPFAAFRNPNGSGSNANRKAGKLKPTQADSRRWDRGGKFATRAPAPKLDEEEVILQQEEIDAYNKMKQELQLWTLAASVVGFSTVWMLNSREAAISYGIGAAGSLLYLRMLHRSMDSMGGGSIGAALGQPRLLIPIVLAMGYHRWNHLKAEEVGLTLQLLPMLLGFFTYKAAVLGKQGGTLLYELSRSFQVKEANQQA